MRYDGKNKKIRSPYLLGAERLAGRGLDMSAGKRIARILIFVKNLRGALGRRIFPHCAPICLRGWGLSWRGLSPSNLRNAFATRWILGRDGGGAAPCAAGGSREDLLNES